MRAPIRYVLALACAAGVVQGCANAQPSAKPSSTTATTTTTAATGSKAPATSIDPIVQRFAEQAINGVAAPVDLIAMRASTGQILAFVSRRGGLPADDALVGRYPAGSTFKIVTTAALIEHGLSPSSTATCPATFTVDGRQVTNFDGQAHAISTLRDAFVHSCNTAFAILGASLPAASFAGAAAQLGLGVAPNLGRRAFGGVVATPTSAFDRSNTASDGGESVVSPLALATVAATIDSGRFRAASLLAPSPVDPADDRRLDPAVTNALRSMMADSVATGTASGQGLPPGTYAKTGTAEFTDRPAPRTTYAWLVGYRNDIAFAVLVVGGTEGGPVAGPITARFLDAIG